MVLDILIRNVPTTANVSVGRTLYTSDDKRTLPNAAEAWRGYFLSARPTCGNAY